MEECSTVEDPTSILVANLSAFLYALNSAFGKKYVPDIPDGFVSERKLIDYVNDKITNQITLKSVAQYVHMSTTQVNRLFKSLTGSSLYQYVSTKRLIMAQEMIESGEGAISTSEKCGFNDYSSFYRLYNKNFGVSPSESKFAKNYLSPDE